MKKILTGVLCLVMTAAFALSSCSKPEEPTDKTPDNKTEDSGMSSIVLPENEEEKPALEYDFSGEEATLIAVNGDMEEVLLTEKVIRMKKQKQTKIVTEEVTAADGTVSTVEKEVEETVEVPVECTLVEIAAGVFMDNTTVKKVFVPDSVTEIGEACFQGCTALEEVTLPAGLTEIGDCMFYGCDKLAALNIPETVTEVGLFAFGDYFKQIPWYTAQTAPSVIIGDGILLKCNAAGTPVTYDNIKKVAYYAFLKSTVPTVTFSESVEDIDDLAFYRAQTTVRLPETSTLINSVRVNNVPVETYPVAADE